MAGQSLEWRLENRRSTAAEFSFVPEFEVIDWGGQKVYLRGADGGSRRIQLKAGEYVGGRYDLHELGLESPGIYRAVWSARVSWSDGEARVSTLPITVEVAAPKK
jgi:hypothetical protein